MSNDFSGGATGALKGLEGRTRLVTAGFVIDSSMRQYPGH
jgi:hypothetical protein